MPRRALVVACLFSVVPLAHSAERAPADRAAPHPSPMSCRAHADKAEGKFDTQLAAERKERH